MSSEEIAARLIKSDHQLFEELAAEVESQCFELETLAACAGIFQRISGEAFRLEHGSVKIIVAKHPGMICYGRIRRFTSDTIPEKDSGQLELCQGSYWLHRRKFSSTTEAGLFMIGMLVPYADVTDIIL